ncbi:glutamate receptor ionotropic, delta-1-like [Clavelina lepadiformis]|uniref:glutamate receptor ionotropic, delta-1-like n=1 Tax=Clavelina lepadiformis TaxID=159417 RepID=UPI004043648B
MCFKLVDVLTLSCIICCVNSKLIIRIGAIFEFDSLAARRALRISVDDVNNEVRVSTKAEVRYVIKNVTRGETLDAYNQACDLLSIGVTSLVSVTSCQVAMTIQSIAESRGIPLLQVTDGNCDRFTSDYVFSTSPKPELLNKAIGQLLSRSGINSDVIVYDGNQGSSKTQNFVSQLNKLSQKRGFPLIFPVKLDEWKEDGLMTARSKVEAYLRSNVVDGLSGVILFTNASNANDIITQTRAGTSPSQQNWIVVDAGLTSQTMTSLSSATSSSVTVVKQFCPEGGANMQSFISRWNDDLRQTSRESRAQLPAEIPFQAFHLYDGVRHLTNAIWRSLQEGTYGAASPIGCRPGVFWPDGKPIMKAVKNINSRGLLGDINISSDGWNKVASFEILKKNSGQTSFQSVGIWNSFTEYQLQRNYSDVIMQNATFRIATLEEAPFVMIDRMRDGNARYTGFAVELLKKISQNLGFKFELYEVGDGKYGARLPNGSWNGLIGDLVKRKADMAVAALTITTDRRKAVDFTERVMDYAVGIATKRLQTTSTLFSFLEPFHYKVWLCIFSSLMFVVVFIYFLHQINPHRRYGDEENVLEPGFSVGGAFWFAYSCLVQQGLELRKASFPVHVVVASWWFFVLIIVTSYTANLAALFISRGPSLPIRSFRHLADQSDIRYGTVSDKYIYDFIMKKGAESSEKNSFYKKMSRMVDSNPLDDVCDGFERASSGGFAFLWDEAVIKYQVLRHKSCAITTISDSIMYGGYGIALQQGSEYRDQMSRAIFELRESGYIDQLRRKWWSQTGNCPLDHEAFSNNALTLKNFTGVFLLLAFGLLVASVIAVAQIAHHVMKKKPYPPTPSGVKNCQNPTNDVSHPVRAIISKTELRHLINEVFNDDGFDARKNLSHGHKTRFVFIDPQDDAKQSQQQQSDLPYNYQSNTMEKLAKSGSSDIICTNDVESRHQNCNHYDVTTFKSGETSKGNDHATRRSRATSNVESVTCHRAFNVLNKIDEIAEEEEITSFSDALDRAKTSDLRQTSTESDVIPDSQPTLNHLASILKKSSV